jgi:diguanylate cyclase
MIDVDDFKKINDTWGHAVGDRVLITLGECILGSCRGTDMVGRCGGDEFAVIFPETGLEEAVKVAERLRSSVEDLTFEHEKIRLTLSIGVAQLDYSGGENLMLEADKRLYRAKALGKNRVVATTEEPDLSWE